MRRTISTSLAVGAATVVLALAVQAAAASPLSVSSRGFRAVWAPLALRSGASEAVRCPVTIEGSFHSSTLNNTSRALIGYVSRATIASAACTGGTATVMTETLPWHVQYESFTGTLPNITGLAVRLVRVGVRGTAAGLTCPYQSTEASPVRAILNRSTESTVTGARVDEAARIPLGSGASSFCMLGGSGTLAGTAGVTALGSTASIRLVPIPPLPPRVVALGDSFIGGEGGRWAGNSLGRTAADFAKVDALGNAAYLDAGTSESIPSCHRSIAAAIYFAEEPIGANYACTGAKTTTFTEGAAFKPGIDDAGQLQSLRSLIQTYPGAVKMIVLSIGGNDFGFSEAVPACVARFLSGGTPCSEDPAMIAKIEAGRIATVREAIKDAILRIRDTMGGEQGYRIVVMDYPSAVAPVNPPTLMRYGESPTSLRRAGGCPIYNSDLTWVTDTVIPAINNAVWAAAAATGLNNIVRLDVFPAFFGRRLCETGVGSIEEAMLADWRDQTAVDKTEWVSRIWFEYPPPAPMMLQEMLHPSLWGQRALRSCLRQVWNYGNPIGGVCRRDANGMTNREPRMTLEPQ